MALHRWSAPAATLTGVVAESQTQKTNFFDDIRRRGFSGAHRPLLYQTQTDWRGLSATADFRQAQPFLSTFAITARYIFATILSVITLYYYAVNDDF